MGSSTGVQVDLLISPFDADPLAVVTLATEAETLGFGSVWTYDHLTGEMFGRGHSNDAFTLLGAIAASTSRVQLGPLVANVVNRHPVRLALAANTLQTLSSGRAIIGLGSGAAPGSRFAREHEALGSTLEGGPERRAMLVEAIGLLRALWSGAHSFEGRFFSVTNFDFGLASANPPPVIIGASGPATAELALEHGDGLNVANMAAYAKVSDLIAANRPREFEVSVHVPVSASDSRPFDAQLPECSEGVDRWIFAVSAQTEPSQLAELFDAACSNLG